MLKNNNIAIKQKIKQEIFNNLTNLECTFKDILSTIDSKCDMYLAGGAVRACIANEKINDFDFYFSCESGFNAIYKYCKDTFIHKNSTDNAETFIIEFNNKKTKIQLIKLMFGTIEEIVNSFDFTVCQGAYSLINDSLFFGEDFFIDLVAKRINVTNNVNFPFVTAMRAIKYCNYGYKLPIITHLKILLKCHAVKCETVQDWKKELFAIDSAYLEKLFEGLEQKQNINSQELLMGLNS